MADKYRLELDFSETAMRDVEVLMEKTRSKSLADFLRHSLRLTQFCLEQSNVGNKLIVESPTGEKFQVVLPFPPVIKLVPVNTNLI